MLLCCCYLLNVLENLIISDSRYHRFVDMISIVAPTTQVQTDEFHRLDFSLWMESGLHDYMNKVYQ